MKISEFVKELQKIKKAHGDIEVNMLDPESLVNGECAKVDVSLALGGEDADSVTEVTIIDPIMVDSLMDQAEDDDE
jgi:hypothetical protein